MSTRGTIGFRLKGKDKITYNHFNSYPESLGCKMFDFVRNTSNDKLKEIACEIILVNQDEAVTPEQRAEVRKASMVSGVQIIDTTVSEQSEEDWYCVLRNTQGNLAVYRDSDLKYMINSNDFMHDSLFCEWAYVINCDDKTLEIYEGFNSNKDAAGRYACRKRQTDSEYCGVKLVVSFPLDVVRNVDDEDLLSIIELFTNNK